MLQNAYFLAKIGADTAENEQHFAEILPIGRRVGRSDHTVARTRSRSAIRAGDAAVGTRQGGARGTAWGGLAR